MDLLGCGQSARLAAEHEYSGRMQADAVREALAALGINEVVLVFHSLATLLLPYLLRDLSGVAGVVLLEGNLLSEDTFWSSKIAAMDDCSFERYFSALQRGGELMLRSMLKSPPHDDDITRFGASFAAMDRRAFRETAAFGYNGTCSGEALRALGSYRGSKLYLRGEHSDAWGGRAALDKAGVRLTMIRNAGHFPHIDNPFETYDAVFGYNASQEDLPC